MHICHFVTQKCLHYTQINMGWVKHVRRSLKAFRGGDIYRNTLKPILQDKLMAMANSSGSGSTSGTGIYTMGGRGKYKRRRTRYTRGRGIYTGSGKYTPATNALISGSKSSNNIVPTFKRVSDAEGTTITRKEYVAEIYGPPQIPGSNPVAVPPFVIQTYNINPGLERTFKWLSQIAANYEEYEIKQLIFTFKSTTTESGNQINGQVGTVIMATNYNAAAGPFQDKNTMMQYAGAGSSRLTESLLHGVECDPKKLSGSAGEYVRSNPVITGQDLKTYDHGVFQIAVANCTGNLANQSLGELWVSYTVKLRKPKFFTGLGFNITKDIFLNNPNSQATSVLSNALGIDSLRGQQNSMGTITTTVGSVTYNPPTVMANYNRGIMVNHYMDPLTGHGVPINTLLDEQAQFPGCTFDPFSNEMTSSLGITYTGTGVSILFPGSYAGNVRIIWSLVANSTSAMTNWGAGPISGNISPNYDLYGSMAGVSNMTTPKWNIASVSWQNSTGKFIISWELHIKVSIASNGVDNIMGIGVAHTASTADVEICYFDIAEYNAGFSYLSTNTGPSTNPVFVNSAGTVVPTP